MTVHRDKFLVNKTNRRTEIPNLLVLRLYMFRAAFPFDDRLLLAANGNQNCIKCTNADVRLRTPDDGRKGCTIHVES
jgi:hypothetical protein